MDLSRKYERSRTPSPEGARGEADSTTASHQLGSASPALGASPAHSRGDGWQARLVRWYGTLLGETQAAIEALAASMSKADGGRWLKQAVDTVISRVTNGELNHLLQRDEL